METKITGSGSNVETAQPMPPPPPAPGTDGDSSNNSADPRLAFAPPPPSSGSGNDNSSMPPQMPPPPPGADSNSAANLAMAAAAAQMPPGGGTEQQQQQAVAAALAAASQQGGLNTGNIYIPPKDEGKMFIGGLNWETTDDSLKNYFSQYGEVIDVTVMRDNATGRSRGFGFLTFENARCVTEVLKKEHFLDGKIIDPKRAIPREEQDKTAKIFVGGVGSDVNEDDFKNFFEQYGTVIDAQLMIDKDTGRPRGFGFVTFDSDQAVEKIVSEKFLILKGKPIEVKKAEPRTKGADGQLQPESRAMGQQQNNYMNGMNPAMMSQYLQRWQAYMSQFQNMMMGQNQSGGQQQAQMNPQMMAQMSQMNPQMMQQMGQMNPQMNPQMMQQMAAAQQQQQQQPWNNSGYDNQGGGGEDDGGAPSYSTEEGNNGDNNNNDDENNNQGGNSYRERDRSYHRNRWNRNRKSDDGGNDERSRSGSASNRRSRSPPMNAPTGPRGGGRKGSGGGRNRNYNNRSGYHPYHRN